MGQERRIVFKTEGAATFITVYNFLLLFPADGASSILRTTEGTEEEEERAERPHVGIRRRRRTKEMGEEDRGEGYMALLLPTTTTPFPLPPL